VDVSLQLSFDWRNIDVESDEVSVELVDGVLEKSVVDSLELDNILIEGVDDTVDVLQLVLAESSELLNGIEQLHELANSSAEKIEATKDLLRREVKLLTLGHIHESLLGELVLLEVSSIEVNAGSHDRDELIGRVVLRVPKDGVILRGTLLWHFTLSGETEVEDGVLARSDHGRGDLGKETSHSVVGAVVTSDGVDHLDGVHQSGKDFFNTFRSTILERLDEFVKSLKILDVVLGLVELLGDSEIETKPLGSCKGNAVLGSGTYLISRGILVGWEASSDNSAVLGTELLGNAGKFSHLLFPEVDLILWTSILVEVLSSFRSVECVLNLGRPLLEEGLEVFNHSWNIVTLGVAGLEELLDLWLIFLGVGLKLDVAVDWLQSFSEFAGELIEDGSEFLLRLILTLLPVGFGKTLKHGLEALVDGGVQSGDGVFWNFSEEDGIILLHISLEWLLVGEVGSEEVETLAEKLDLLAVSNYELLGMGVLDLDLVVVWGDRVLGLVVNENVCWTCVLEEGV
jgi:hypothetical protein